MRNGFVLGATVLLSCLVAVRAQTNAQPSRFFLGADVSALAAPRAGRLATAYQELGKPGEEWEILMRHGWNCFSLRVFVSPVRSAPNNSLENIVPLAPRGISVMYWAPERDVWNADGTPGPAVFTMDKLAVLGASPGSHAPAAVRR